MADSYGRKYKKSKRPECFSDPDEYDLKDRVCRNCDWKRPCKTLVLKKIERAEAEDEDGTVARGDRHHKDPEDFEEREDDGGLGFFGSLAVNSSLYAVGVALGEAQYAVDQIPRFPYEDPFEKAITRGRNRAQPKKKSAEDEEDE